VAVFEYTGPDRALYGFLLHGSGVAPFTMHAGELVDFGDREPPEGGHWRPAPAGAAGRLPDNHPDYRYPDGAHDPRPQHAVESGASDAESSGTEDGSGSPAADTAAEPEPQTDAPKRTRTARPTQ
jgi:hypothetical protein